MTHEKIDTRIPVALTIAGSDSGGGAGIQADIKAMQANGVYAASVLTAVTAQNTQAVTAAEDLPLSLIAAQLDAVCSDMNVAAVKTGMLSSGGIIRTVVDKIDAYGLRPLVVDPVMISKSGYALLADDAVAVLKAELLPRATLVTPNLHEAAALTGLEVRSVEEAREAAVRIHAMGPNAVLVKGGHLEEAYEAIDVLYDGSGFEIFSAPFVRTDHTHGTGCTYSAAITANLAHGANLKAAIWQAKRYVTEAIRHGLAIGKGHGPTHHFYFLDEGNLPGRTRV